MASVYIGPMYFKYSALGNEALYTRVYVIGFPIFPMSASYGIKEDYWTVTGPAVRINRAAVFRVFLPIICLLSFFPITAANILHLWIFYLVGGIQFVVCAYLWFVLGKPGPREFKQRRLLGIFTKTTVNPDWLTPESANELLRGCMPEAVGTSLDAVRKLLKQSGNDSVRRAFVIASYRLAITGETAWSAIRQEAWARLESLPESILFSPIEGSVAPASVPPMPAESIGLESLKQNFPEQCCSCLAPTTTQVAYVSRKRGDIGFSGQRPRVVIPTCLSCQQLFAGKRRTWILSWMLVGFVIIGGLTMWIVHALEKSDHNVSSSSQLLVGGLTFGAIGAAVVGVIMRATAPSPVRVEVAAGGGLTARFENGAYTRLLAKRVRKPNAAN